MNTTITRNSAPIDTARDLLDGALRVYRKEPSIRAELEGHRRRLDEPLRVALVGSVKAGKSTLLNALLSEHLAPTDARECTRVVTWYRHGATPKVEAFELTGGVTGLPVVRQQERLELDLGELGAESLDRLEVVWPAEQLNDLILIDTPGTASISSEVSSRTQQFLAPQDGVSGVDAVVYMLRSLHTSDIDFLHHLHARTSHGASALGSIAVLSRADELGGGRLDAMVSVNQAVKVLRAEPALTGLVEAVVPVAGLLALASSTLRQSEYAAFVALEEVPRETLQSLLVSADRFISTEDETLPSVRVRARLVERFGLYGIRLAVATLRSGVTDATMLSEELVRRSGLDELRSTLDIHFRQRSQELKAHSAVLAVHRALSRQPRAEGRLLLETAEEYLNNSHAFREMRLISRVRSVDLAMEESALAELTQLIGGNGTTPHQRLGLDEDASPDELYDAAHEALWRWLDLVGNPLTEREVAAACRVVVRSCEGIIDRLTEPTWTAAETPV
ncbi:dynamin family protein [Aeromicrobium sp. A1-2]|uniref:dynamin family protein n=1 Tax=Aeromicrobium sp. A1-2 TaxID=2107713 RepID=UPI0013C36143|nr:dynamin family protein [Aeromicrobium sp. A1-2]